MARKSLSPPRKHPNRSGPTVSEKTLLDLAQERNLLSSPPPPQPASRLLDSCLWSASLSMLHFTFDLLVQHQYGTEIIWSELTVRTLRAWLLFSILVYTLHPHQNTSLPLLPSNLQRPARQSVFFVASLLCGCYLIHLSNTAGYLATMKRAPPLGCLWLWAVVELDLTAAVVSLAAVALFLWRGGYDIK
ncbi:hypothetical protein L249_1602 [Ophiocordyceps polyrhachis-furcata BCC 54312]|uniref:DUF7719 domain-containing protein n=1 Tax=Ophiocordyceps polyrhachis-furcata BCC 54312 TaxID=1330021 RepID=A0A367KZF8_9HYPO|nr:hypothetical protein L249_1602 [Ophiocordyceps polyrhachis-furcata BCC 54312]